ncbi:MAG: ABC transporter ATP-binding protein [Candidatus Dojkabacteria bacterium]|nr:MAG: ABC transporter ATP-binding protein [Candidatus Dojkabacteria bacterium]
MLKLTEFLTMIKNFLKNITHFLATLFWSTKVVLSMSPLLVSLKFLISIVLGSAEWINVFLIAQIIDRLVQYTNGTTQDTNNIFMLLGIIVVFNLLSSLLSWAESLISNHLKIKIQYAASILLYKKLISLGVEALENPQIADEVQRFKDNYSVFNSFVWNITYILNALVYLTLIIPSLINIIPWFIVLSILMMLPKFYIHKKHIQQIWKLDKEVTSDERKAWGSFNNIANPVTLKEIYITNSFNFLKQIFVNFYNSYLHQIGKIRFKWFLSTAFVATVDRVLVGIGLLIIVNQALEQTITIGLVTFYFSLLTRFGGTINQIVFALSNINEGYVRIEEIKSFLNREPIQKDGTITLKGNHAPKIEFKNVSFKYPGSDKYVYENFNLTINPGEKLAIVGKNGAGKTTLMKLITRFYQVTSGEILIDGININDLKIESWYKKIGGLFQDYNTYPDLTAFENIFIGKPEGNENDEEVKNKVIKASKDADAYEFIAKYPKKFDQTLSERYTGGIRPSTGQWQKIALARFFFRDPYLLILDEPTASIDAEAEYQIFNNIYQFIKNKTVIIISHRFSTVKNADRIIVIDEGKIIEEGSHDQLMKKNGTYARFFKLQAKGYKTK